MQTWDLGIHDSLEACLCVELAPFLDRLHNLVSERIVRPLPQADALHACTMRFE